MRNRTLLIATSMGFLSPLAHAFTITPNFVNSNPADGSAQVWTVDEEAIVNQAISDWTSILSYSDPNQNINMNFNFVAAGGNLSNPNTFLAHWVGTRNPPAGENVFPYSLDVTHNVNINTDLMVPRNAGVNYPDYLLLAFTSAAPTINQFDALSAIREQIGQSLGFSTLYVDSAGGSLASNKWQDHVTFNGSTAVFDQTPGGLNMNLTSGSNFVHLADPNDLMNASFTNGVRTNIGFQDVEALSLAYGYNITVNAGTLFNTPTFKTQTITMNGTVLVAPTGASRQTPTIALTTQNITFGASGLLDISNHDLIIHGGSNLTQVRALVAAGIGNGTFNGTTGITSSTANASGLTLAVGTAAGANTSAFDGDPVSPTDILVKYTYLGDSNMDGRVDLTDLSIVLNNFGTSTANWTDGNFDNAATIDLTDLSDVLNNFGRVVAQGSLAGGSAGNSVAAAPEPASLSLLVVAAPVLLRRKRTA